MTTENADLPYRLGLLRVPGVGPVKFANTLKTYSSARHFFEDTRITPDWKGIDTDLIWATDPFHHIITKDSAHYPQRLREISAAPPILFITGDKTLIAKPQLAMVGSRNPTPDGADIAYHFAKTLSQSGLVITSGLALGIDGACHEGVLDAKGETIAVMGTGPDIIYPRRHQPLARKILDRGCLVTEFPTGITPASANFPRRNRLISGLSIGVLVIEAAYASGSLVTAKYALEQNREIFAIPGSIHNPLARGCHALIKQGAKLVETVEDILEELGFLKHAVQVLSPVLKKPSQKNPFLNYIGFETTPIDTLISRSGLTAEEVSSILLTLELDEQVKSVPGGYVRVYQ